MSEDDEYLLDDHGQPYHYADGRPVKLEDFDQEPSWSARAEALSTSPKETWQSMLDDGINVPDVVIKKYDLVRSE